MASGDTKTEALLNVLGNGGSIEGITGSGNTKTQNYIIDAINRIQNVENEVSEIINNPDVVDIVNTYADLQAYDTQHLVDKAVIRVLNDETHDGHSTYYRYDKSAGTWTYIGEDSGGGGGVTVLSATNYNYPVANPTGIALYALDDGLYYVPAGVNHSYWESNSINYTSVRSCFVIVRKSAQDQGLFIRFSPEGFWSTTGDSNANTKQLGTAVQVYYDTSTLAPITLYNKAGFITTEDIKNDLTSTNQKLPLSANQGKVLKGLIDGLVISGAGAPTTSTVGTVGQLYEDTTNGKLYICTDATNPYVWAEVGAGGGGNTPQFIELTTDDYDYPTNNPNSVAAWKLDPGFYTTNEASLTIRSNTSGSYNLLAGQSLIVFGQGSGTKLISRTSFTGSQPWTWDYVSGSNGSLYQTATIPTYIENSLTSVSNTQALAANQGRVLNEKINSISNYSTSEVNTGTTWIDGKTIYKKTIDTGALPDSTNKQVAHGITNLSRVIKFEGYAFHSGNTVTIPLPLPSTTDSNSVMVNVSGANLVLSTLIDRSGFTESYVTLYYTKSA